MKSRYISDTECRNLDKGGSRLSRIRWFIIASSLLACLLLYIVEQVLAADYLMKTLVKILLFTSIPWFYTRFLQTAHPGATVKESRGRYPGNGSVKAGLILGAAAAVIILITYSLLQNTLDLPVIAQELQQKSKVTPANFLLVGLYITFGNSFLEEFFFRGFIFLSLHRLGQTMFAYVFSSLLFGLYHIAIFQTWFNPWLIGLALLGLIATGFVFNYLDAKINHFSNSWLTHILADAAIMLIGLRVFEMI